MKGTEITKEARRIVYERDSINGWPCCVYCGKPAMSEFYLSSGVHIYEGIEQHHIVERSRGGKGQPENLVCLCSACHTDLHNGNSVIKKFVISYMAEHYTNWQESDQIMQKGDL